MRKLASTFLFLLLLSLGGCLEFDGQEITLHYDAAADRIDALVLYRGLFAESGSGSTTDPLGKAIQDLASAREEGEVAVWNNWPVSFRLAGDYDAPIKALLAHVDVECGSLFTDPKGVLCGYQFVRIRDAKAFVKQVNTLLELGSQAALVTGIAAPGGHHQFDDDTKELVRDFLRSGQKMLVVEPGRIELRLPLSAKDHAWAKDVLEKHVRSNLPREVLRRDAVATRRASGGDVSDTSLAENTVTVQGESLDNELAAAPSFRFFWDNDWSLQREPELTTVGLGVRGEQPLRIVKAAGGLYHDQLLKGLRERKETIEDGLPEQEITRRFEQFHQRDAVLPAKVAAMRERK